MHPIKRCTEKCFSRCCYTFSPNQRGENTFLPIVFPLIRLMKMCSTYSMPHFAKKSNRFPSTFDCKSSKTRGIAISPVPPKRSKQIPSHISPARRLFPQLPPVLSPLTGSRAVLCKPTTKQKAPCISAKCFFTISHPRKVNCD